MINYINSYRYKNICRPGQECYVTFESEPVTFDILAGPIPGIFYSNITTQPGYAGAIPGIFYNSSTTAPGFSGSTPGLFFNSTTTSPTFTSCDLQGYGMLSMLLPMTGIIGSTLFNDLSSVPKTISPSGNVQITDAQSKWGTTSGAFDGTGDYLSTSYVSSFNWWSTDFTIEYWIYINDLASMSYVDGGNTNSVVIGNAAHNSATNYWSFGPISTGVVRMYYYNGSSQSVSSTSTVTTGVWTHIAMVKNSAGINIFVDGVGLTSPVAVVGTPQSSATVPLLIGQINNTSMNAYMNDLRITTGMARYSADFTPPTQPFPTSTGC